MTPDFANERRRLRRIEATEHYERPQLNISWMAEAACRGTSPEMWFPAPGDLVTTRAAMAICDGCPVRSDCEEHAIAAGEEQGVRGGLSEKQRALMRDARERTARRRS
jgi:WhiB family redox-sensing transcriptional regulator